MPQACGLAPGGKRGRVGMAPGEPSALSGAWPPAQTLARPQGPPLALCAQAKGLQEPRAAHPDWSTGPQRPSVFFWKMTERSLQDMLEHECPLKNEQVLRVSAACRGQRAGLGVLCTACPCPSPSPGLAGLRACNLLGRGPHPFTSALLAGASGRG